MAGGGGTRRGGPAAAAALLPLEGCAGADGLAAALDAAAGRGGAGRRAGREIISSSSVSEPVEQDCWCMLLKLPFTAAIEAPAMPPASALLDWLGCERGI